MTVTDTHVYAVGGRTVAFTLRRSDRARHARLEISARGGLTVVVPANYSTDRVRLLLNEKRRWITAKLDKYGDTESPTPRRPVTAGDTLPYLGRELKIETVDGKGKTAVVCIDRRRLVLSVAGGHGDLRQVLERWYRSEARDQIAPMVDEICHRMGVSHNEIRLKGHRSLWGSCSRTRNLNFNWRLVMTPIPVIEYVVIHELAHLKEMNHSPRFWRIVESYCPEWRARRQWLTEHSQLLASTLAAQR
jgi:predicted metal-dependent hydrolase